MCEASIAAKSVAIICAVPPHLRQPWLINTVSDIRLKLGDPALKVKDMRGEALGLYLDAQLQFLVEQTGRRATMSRDRVR